jgi:hypothetical protein
MRLVEAGFAGPRRAVLRLRRRRRGAAGAYREVSCVLLTCTASRFVLGSSTPGASSKRAGAPVCLRGARSERRARLYELRPLVRAFIEEREPILRARQDALLAVEELRREPAASIFAHAHAGPRATEDQALFRTVLLGLLIATAEACGGFDWDDESFERAYAQLESSLYGDHRLYTAIAPLAGISLSKAAELAPGMVTRPFAPGELSTHWPESRGLLPRGFGREPDRNCVLESVMTWTPATTARRVADRHAVTAPC